MKTLLGPQLLVAGGLVVALAGCGSPTPAPSTRVPVDGTTTSVPAAGPLVVVSPEFVQGVIPDERLVLLVAPVDPGGSPVTVTAEADFSEVSVEPGTISGNDVAEVTVVPHPAVDATQMAITVVATAGDESQTVSKTVVVEQWEDDRGRQGSDILGLFTRWLAENRPELGITEDTVFTGTYVAPDLLVVSHYCFFGDRWEIGVAWHIMVPPDDFAEAYLRPRDGLRPEYAFRVGSWQTAFETGQYDVTEVTPPAEVVR